MKLLFPVIVYYYRFCGGISMKYVVKRPRLQSQFFVTLDRSLSEPHFLQLEMEILYNSQDSKSNETYIKALLT